MILSMIALLAMSKGVLQANPGTISTANVAGFSSPPSSASPWTPLSYAMGQSNGGTMYVSVTSSSAIGTFGAYVAPGDGSIAQVPNTSITRFDNSAVGAISAGVTAIYSFQAPPGNVYLGASAWSGGSVKAFFTTGPALATAPGSGGGATAAGQASLLAVQTLSENPYSLCLFDKGGAGDTVGVEFLDASLKPIPFVDSNSVSWSAITVTLGAAASLGLSYGILHTSPDGSHAISALPTGAVAARLTVLSGTANIATVGVNCGGTVDGSAGTGTTGYNTGYAPNVSSPVQLFVLDSRSFGTVRQ